MGVEVISTALLSIGLLAWLCLSIGGVALLAVRHRTDGEDDGDWRYSVDQLDD